MRGVLRDLSGIVLAAYLLFTFIVLGVGAPLDLVAAVAFFIVLSEPRDR